MININLHNKDVFVRFQNKQGIVRNSFNEIIFKDKHLVFHSKHEMPA